MLTTGNEYDFELLIIASTAVLIDLTNRFDSDEELDFKSKILECQNENNDHQKKFIIKNEWESTYLSVKYC